MTNAAAGVGAGARDVAHLHATLRFATAVTTAFVLGEFAQWTPPFMAAVLTSAVLGNLPIRPPFKLGVLLVATMTLAATYAFVVSALLRGTPWILFGLIALSMLLAFHSMLSGKPRLVGLLALICLGIIPVVVMVAPAYAGVLPRGMALGITLAMLMIFASYAIWPTPPPVREMAPTPGPGGASPLSVALLSVAAVLPVMLVYMLFGLTDVMPALIGTILLVSSFDVNSTRHLAVMRILANLGGGLLGVLIHTVLMTTPTLLFLGILLFLATLAFGQRIYAGGPPAQMAVIACNAMLIILGSTLMTEGGSVSAWLLRVFLFALAGAISVGIMSLLWHWFTPKPLVSPSN